MDKRITSVKLALVFTGIILGAGFASGQELIAFFVRFGAWGLCGIGLSAAILGFLLYAVLKLCARFGVNDYDGFLDKLMGRKLGTLLSLIAMAFMAVLFSAMLSGCGAALEQIGGSRLFYYVGAAGLALVSFVVFCFDLDGILAVNVALTPILIVAGTAFGLYSIITSYKTTFLEFLFPITQALDNWVFSSILYASYNIVTAVCVMVSMASMAKTKRVMRGAGILSALFLGVLGLVFAFPLFLNLDAVRTLEIPMLYIANKSGAVMEVCYLLLLVCAMLTTAVANGFALINWLCAKTNADPLAIKVIVVVLGLTGAGMGFSNIVGIVYTAFGYLGLFQLIVIVMNFVLNTKEKG